MKKTSLLSTVIFASLLLSGCDDLVTSKADREIQRATFSSIPDSGIMVSELLDDEQKTFIFKKVKDYKGYKYRETFKALVNCVKKEIKITHIYNTETVHFFWEEVKSGATISKKDEQALTKLFCR